MKNPHPRRPSRTCGLTRRCERLRATYGYDDAFRLQTVNDGDLNTATYSRLANPPLVSQIVCATNGVQCMITAKTYDYLSCLTQISSLPAAQSLESIASAYTCNPANQRTNSTLADGSRCVYGCDSLGQITNGCKHFTDGTPVPGQQLDYAFNTIGNRLQTWSVGNTNRTGLFQANYTNNALNQIVRRSVPPFVDVKGANLLTNTVRNYVWATELSGSQQGAGGVGGLLEVSYYDNYANIPADCWACGRKPPQPSPKSL